jgi:tetratricopeptide (TPR) repeat protein
MNYLKLQTQAYKQMLLGQYDRSLEDYEICLNFKPDDLTNYWYIGLIYFLRGNELEAQAIWMTVLFQEISEREKSHTEDLIRILEKELFRQVKLSNLELAKRLKQQIQELDENYTIEKLDRSVQVTIAKLLKEANQLKKKGNYPEAESKYQQILFWNHQNAEVWRDLGLLYLQVVEYGKALDCVMNAIHLNPAIADYYYNVGLISEHLKQIPQSIKAYYKALALDPSLMAAYDRLGNLLSSSGELEAAAKIQRRAQ